MLLRQSFIFLIFILSLTLLGCTSDKIVKTYEGKGLDEKSIAVLTAPENITILSVNGLDVQQYLLSNLNVNYGLKTGENLVVFKYESIWSRARRDEETGARVDVVESEPLEVLINAKPGEKYNFSFIAATNVREARELASGFSAQVLDKSKNLIAESMPVNTTKEQKVVSATKDQELLLEAGSVKGGDLENGDKSVLDVLKSTWPSASAEEKKAFLVWVFQK